jgi:hypothetical protein
MLSDTQKSLPLPQWQELCGALHLHTTRSDGSVDVAGYVRTARQLALDYIVLTDHMALPDAQQQVEGFHDGLFVLAGYEHNDEDNRNHYLVIGTQGVIPEQKNVAHYVDAVRQQGGIGFIAHPFEKRCFFRGLPGYPWTAREVRGFDGIEIWNQMSDWVEHLKPGISLIRLLYPHRLLKGPPRECLSFWDMLNRESFISGIGGVDAHTKRIGIGPFRFLIFPLKVELKGVRTHLFLNEPLDVQDAAQARRSLMDALRDGRGFVSNFRWGDARGSRIWLERSDGSVQMPGRLLNPLIPPATLRVRLSRKGTITLIHNGKASAVIKSAAADFPINHTGVYRIEVRRATHPWIYSNPFPVGSYPL